MVMFLVFKAAHTCRILAPLDMFHARDEETATARTRVPIDGTGVPTNRFYNDGLQV